MARTSPAVPAEPARVIDLTLEGLGVLAPGGKRVLVPGVLPGELVRYERRRRHRNYDEGRVLEVLEPSADRVEPRCTYFGTCGGCAVQHQATAAQLATKQAALLEALERIGRVTPDAVLPPLAGSPWGYRRRARLAARYVGGKDRVLVGFRERDTSFITDMTSCATLSPALGELLPALSALAGRLSIRAHLPQVEATAADNATALVIRHLKSLTAADEAQLDAFAREHGVRFYLQPGDESTVAPFGAGAEGLPELCYGLPEFGLEMSFGPVDFIQVHAEVNRLMVSQAVALLDPGPRDRVLDLYCGIGNFTLPLATRAGEVLGLEGAAAAVRRAGRNATRAGRANARFVQADLAGAGTGGAWTRESFDLVLLDPPRSGAAELMPLIPATGARRVVYVSCHPGTLARDAALLAGAGYALRAAGIMDMFPQTSHVESMAVFERG